VTRRDDLLVDLFRSSGALLLRGIEVRVPALPRTTSAMTILRVEAKADPAVRKAYEAAVAQAERVRQLKPQVLRRSCGEILEVR
jgi:hypothetical protein